MSKTRKTNIQVLVIRHERFHKHNTIETTVKITRMLKAANLGFNQVFAGLEPGDQIHSRGKEDKVSEIDFH